MRDDLEEKMMTTCGGRRWPALVTVVVLAVSALVAGVPSAAAGSYGAVVRTDAGPVRGTVHHGYRTFQGVPFAAPPTGELRWQLPQPVEPWSGLLDATRPGNRCAQNPDELFGTAGSTTEDCLYLNVTTPRSATPRHPKPVIVWLHGGGLIAGAGSDYDARRLAVDGDVVVVTVNYRLGIFGFLSHPGLADAGGFGFADQQAALRWVQANAAAFGGDPGNVTLMGESAGSESVCTQLASPSAAGLFHKAITQSAACVGEVAASRYPRVLDLLVSVSLQESDAFGLYLAEQLGCADPADAGCLRGLSTRNLLQALIAPRPVYGNSLLPEDPQQMFREGRFHKVPVLSGMTRDEATIWVALFYPEPITPQRYQELLSEFFGEAAAAVAQRYPLSAFASPGQAWAAIMTDREHAGPEQVTTHLFARHVPVYAYEFTDRAAPPALLRFPPDLPPGASHGSEVAYLLSPADGRVELAPDQERLSDQMIAYWSSFAHDSDPNAEGLPTWPPFDGDEEVPYVQELGPGEGGIGSFDRAAEHQLSFWAGLS
jgi:para-nitrobenzyl esterase